MLRSVLAVVLGCVAWVAVATLGNLGLRGLIEGYSSVEASFAFTLPMLAGRLLVGAASTLAAGYAVCAVAPGRRGAVWAFAALLLSAFVPMHLQLWPKFPSWYHAIFLGSLVPLALYGARLAASARTPDSAAAA